MKHKSSFNLVFPGLLRRRKNPSSSHVPSRPGLRVLLALLVISSTASLDAAETAPPDGAPPPAPTGPKIEFEKPIYDFGKVRAGDPVKHTFIFTNLGDATLILANVQPSCGCTTAGEWSRQVEPGKTGTIPVQFNSGNYSGPVTKTVTVTSNDKRQPSLGLQIKGTLWKPIEVTPQLAVLNLPAGAQTNATTVVRIVSNLDEPITLSAPESNNRAFTAQLTPTQPGKEFQLTISAAPPFEPGKAQAQITLKTSSTNSPLLTVNAWANVQPTVAAHPAPPPLAPLSDPSQIQNPATKSF
jgi:hypothetical protein